jgi:hypothetical protein
MQVLERSLVDGIFSRVTRLSCEIGVPKKLFIDQDRASICGLEFDMRGLQQQLERQYMGLTSRCARLGPQPAWPCGEGHLQHA